MVGTNGFCVGFCNEPMCGNIGKPKINMALYETEIEVLEHFLRTEDIGSEISDRYLILYNFATDCIYAEHIQAELIQYLLPFYWKSVSHATIYENKIAMTILPEFNTAMFANRDVFIEAVGTDSYQAIMEYYIELTLMKMSRGGAGILAWVSQFNTTIALAEGNIKKLFLRIFQNTMEVKPMLHERYGEELLTLFRDEMDRSFLTDIFVKRKREFLLKITKTATEGYVCWDVAY